MKKIRKSQLAAFILCIALILSNLQPAGVVYASTLPSLETETEAPKETNTPEETPEQQTPAPIETEAPEPEQTPEEMPIETDADLPTETPKETVSPTDIAEPSVTPAEDPLESPDGIPTEEPSETPTETPMESITPTPSESVKDLDYIFGRPMTEEEIARQKAAVPSYLPMLPEEEKVEAYESGIALFAAIPDKFDSRIDGYVTSVKNQNPYGTCWAYATMASLEGSMLVAGRVGTDIDLSEWHLAYFATHTGSDELGNTKGDYVNPLEDEYSYMNSGGNILMAATALSNWKGAAKEKDYPYPTGYADILGKRDTTTPDDAWKKNAYYMSDCYITPISDADAVKTLIMANGAVYGSYYHDDYFQSWSTAAYFNDKNTYTNHAIAIVGWDDNYSKENFTDSFYGRIDHKKPEGNGAWICKNSWGSTFGDKGYFYISYYDTSIKNSSAAAFIGKELERDLNNYYYSGGVCIGSYSYTYGIAQCYEAKANEDGAETIEGVGFFTLNAGVDYTVEVYINPTSKDKNGVITNPKSGELVYQDWGQTAYAGYNTIDIYDDVVVKEGDVFSVVITFDNETKVYFDQTHTMWASGTTKLYDSVNTVTLGESFYNRSYGSVNYFVGSSGSTPRMNVITRDVEEPDPIFYVYNETGGKREELGRFSTWKKAVNYLSANGDSLSDYRIEVTQNAAVKGSLTMPENIHGLIVSGSVSEETSTDVTLQIDDSITAKSLLIFQDIILLPQTEIQIDVGGYEVRFEQVSVEGEGIGQITGNGMATGSFYTDRTLTVAGDVKNLASLILEGGCFSAISMDIGDLYLYKAREQGKNTECRIAGTLFVDNIINSSEENVISVSADMDNKTGVWNPGFTITGTVTEKAVYVRLMERLTGEKAGSVEFPDGNYYAPVSFYTKDGKGRYFFRSMGSVYMQFTLVKAPLVDTAMIQVHPDNSLPFGGTGGNDPEANSFKRNGDIVYIKQVQTIVLSYNDDGRTVLDDIITYQDAIDEINGLKVKRDYTITLIHDIDSVNGNSLKPGALTLPKADCISSLTIEGDGHRICFTGNTITTTTDLTLRNVTLMPLKANSDKDTKATEPYVSVMDERAAGYQYPAVVTLKTGSYGLTIGDVTVEAPLLLNGSKGTLEAAGTIITPDYQSIDGTTKYVCSGLADGMAGNISGYAEVSIASDFSLRPYYTAATKKTGGTFTATRVEQKADLWVQGKLTADYLHQESDSALKVGVKEDDGYAPVVSDAVIKDYRTSAGCSCIVTGKLTSANKAGIYGAADKPVNLQADKIAFKDVTLSHAQVTAGKDFAITGILVSETTDNRLVTRQKADAKGKITDVYLNITGTVLLSEAKNQIEIQVKEAASEDNAGLCNAPSAEGLLVNAKTAEALHFRPAEENYEAGTEAKLVKKGTKIYLYEAGGAPVEVSRIRNGEEVSLGSFPTLEEASKAVDAKKDKTASYVFTLYSSLGETKPEKVVFPVNAADITLTAAEEGIVLHTAGDITLKTNTTLEQITLSPDYGKGTANISMGKYRLTLKEMELAPNKSINKITADTKSSEGLELYGSAAYYVGSGGLTVPKLTIGAGTELTSGGKAVVTTLTLKEDAVFTIAQKGSAITNIADYQSCSEEAGGDFSRLCITSGADLTINGSVENQTGGALAVVKEGVSSVNALSEITGENKILSAPKAAASSFMILSSDLEKGEIPFKHEKGLYLPGENVEGLLQIQLVYGEKESCFVDWYQAVTEINTLGDDTLSCQITLLDNIEETRRIDGKGTVITSPGALLMPSAGKCNSLTVNGDGKSLTFTGNMTVNTSGIFAKVNLNPVKVNKGQTIPAVADITMKTGKSGVTRLTFDQCGEDAGIIAAGSVADGTLFGNVKGDGKGCEVYLINNSAFNIKGNVTGLKGLYLGMDEAGEAAGAAVLGISGKAEVKTLGLTGTDGDTLESTRLLVTGSFTADTLAGSNGILLVKQKSAKDNSTNAIIKGSSAIPAGKTTTVLVMQPDITSAETYLQKLEEGENPFIEDPMDIPLLQAPIMQAEQIKTAGVLMDDDGLKMQQLEGVVYYRDTKQYIKAGLGERMKVKITARSENGASASTYAESWYEAIQMLDGMGNNYTWYGLELTGSGQIMTGMNTKTKEEAVGKFLLPSKVKGTVEIIRGQESDASLIYMDNIKIPDKLTLIVNEVPLEQIDGKGNVVSRGITIGNGSMLTLTGGSEEFSTIAAPKGSLGLNQTKISVSGKVDIKNLCVSDGENELAGMGDIKIHTIMPLEENGLGKVCLDTVSKYGKSKTGYDMTQLSQLSINGSVDEKVDVGIHISKDSSVIGQDENTEYTQEELLLASDEEVSLKKRLAAVGGNAADSRIALLDGEGNQINGEDTNCLLTEAGGLYLSSEAPSVSVSSSGGTSKSEYQGRFRTVEAALKAIGISAKEDIALSKDNVKNYQVTFEKQPEKAVALNMPTNVNELVFTVADNSSRINLTFTGNLTLKSNTSFEYMNLLSVNNKGAVSTATINAGNYKLSFIQAEASEKVTLKGGAKGELFVTGSDEEGRAAALQGFGQVTIEDANLHSTGNVTVQNLHLENAFLRGKNITISKKTEMEESTLSAVSDWESASGKLKIAELCSLNRDGYIKNVLAAKQDAKGNSGIEITGKVSAPEAETEYFVIALYQNENYKNLVALEDDTVLLKAAVADGDFFVPISEMRTEKTEYGIYKSGKNLRYGDISQAEAVLVADAGTKFFSMEEAIAEINSRKDKKASYTIELLQDAEMRNAKGALTSLTMPSYAGQVIIKGAESEQRQIAYTGKLTLKCNTIFENIKLVTYKTSGKNTAVTEGTLAGGNYQLGISKEVDFGGSVQGGTIVFEDNSGLRCTSVKAANISCDGSADLYIARDGLITVTGLLKKGSVTNITIHLDYGKVPNGTKIIAIKSLSGKADLIGLQIEDTTGGNSYILYQDGRAVYCRREQ